MSTLRRTRRYLIGAVALAGALLALPAAAQTSADLRLTLSGTAPTGITYGQFRTINYVVTNLGPSVATGLQITSIAMDSHFAYSISGCTPLEANAAGVLVPCTIDDGTIYDEPDVAHPVNQKTFSVTIEMPSQDADGNWIYPATCDADTVLAPVVVTIGADNADPVAANNTRTVPDPAATTPAEPAMTILPFWDLAISLTAPAGASVGQDIQVHAEVVNNGPCAATEVSVNDFWFGATSQTLGFVEAVGDCTSDTLMGDGCFWDQVNAHQTMSWDITYKVLALPAGLIHSGDPVYMDVVSDGAPYFGVADSRRGAGTYKDVNAANDAFQTQTIVSQSHSGCSTGDFGGALGLLLVAVPFLRRRRQS